MSNRCAIIIPLYTNKLKKYELESINSAKRHFKENDIFFVCPSDLDITAICNNEKQIARFGKEYFKGVVGYCLLCTSSCFYGYFKNLGYDYMLIHQTDTYTFYNNLDYFMELGYDYYGAPLYGIVKNKKSLWYKSSGVGNGGYSLRKISKMFDITEKYGPVKIVEDAWFCSQHADLLNICPESVAKKFSTIAEKIKGEIPMGCHGGLVKKEFYNLYDKNKNVKPMKEKENKKVVYTCITGSYDGLIEPTNVLNDYDYICFTDDMTLKSNVWEIRPLPEETNNLDNVRKNRYLKLHPHVLFPEYDMSIYVDGSIKITGDLNTFTETCDLDKYSVAIPKHPVRTCIYKEGKVCISLKKDTAEHINPQMERYKAEEFPENYGLTQNNIIIRKHNDKNCIKVMEEWWEEILKGSYRDQLSFFYVLWKNPDFKIKELPSSTCNSIYFKWYPVHAKKKITSTATKTPVTTKLPVVIKPPITKKPQTNTVTVNTSKTNTNNKTTVKQPVPQVQQDKQDAINTKQEIERLQKQINDLKKRLNDVKRTNNESFSVKPPSMTTLYRENENRLTMQKKNVTKNGVIRQKKHINKSNMSRFL